MIFPRSILRVKRALRCHYVSQCRQAGLDPSPSSRLVSETIKGLLRHRDASAADVWRKSAIYEFPTGQINAQALQADEGCVVLLNTGLFMYIYQFARIFSRALGLEGDFKEGDYRDPTAEANERAVKQLVNVIIPYLFLGDPAASRRLLRAKDAWRFDLECMLTSLAEQFVLAHEYGHIALDHFSDGDLKEGSLSGKRFDLSTLPPRFRHEHEADYWAVDLLLRNASNDTDSELTLDQRMSVVFSSVALFMVGAHLAELSKANLIVMEGGEYDPLSYPPCLDRLNYIRNHFGYSWESPHWKLAKLIVDWCHTIKGHLEIDVACNFPNALAHYHEALTGKKFGNDIIAEPKDIIAEPQTLDLDPNDPAFWVAPAAAASEQTGALGGKNRVWVQDEDGMPMLLKWAETMMSDGDPAGAATLLGNLLAEEVLEKMEPANPGEVFQWPNVGVMADVFVKWQRWISACDSAGQLAPVMPEMLVAYEAQVSCPGAKPFGNNGPAYREADDLILIDVVTAARPKVSFDIPGLLAKVSCSLSLSFMDKIRIVDALPVLSDSQIEGLHVIFAQEILDLDAMPDDADVASAVRWLREKRAWEWTLVRRRYLWVLRGRTFEWDPDRGTSVLSSIFSQNGPGEILSCVGTPGSPARTTERLIREGRPTDAVVFARYVTRRYARECHGPKGDCDFDLIDPAKFKRLYLGWRQWCKACSHAQLPPPELPEVLCRWEAYWRHRLVAEGAYGNDDALIYSAENNGIIDALLSFHGPCHFDVREFGRQLENSRSLSVEMKRGVIDRIAHLTQSQIDDLIETWANETEQFSKLPPGDDIELGYLVEGLEWDWRHIRRMYLADLIGLLQGRPNVRGTIPLFKLAESLIGADANGDRLRLAQIFDLHGRHLAGERRLAEAEQEMQNALRLRIDSIGAADPMVARSMWKIARLLQITGRPSEAEALYRQVIGILEHSAEPRHKTVLAVCLNNLILLLIKDGRESEAVVVTRQYLALRKDSLEYFPAAAEKPQGIEFDYVDDESRHIVKSLGDINDLERRGALKDSPCSSCEQELAAVYIMFRDYANPVALCASCAAPFIPVSNELDAIVDRAGQKDQM